MLTDQEETSHVADSGQAENPNSSFLAAPDLPSGSENFIIPAVCKSHRQQQHPSKACPALLNG
jgi:hypothetical protein